MTTQTTAGVLWWLNDDVSTSEEILNDERARRYNFHQHPRWVGNLCDTCGCPALTRNPLTGAAYNFGTYPTDGPDTAPWAIQDAYAADEFLGFITSEITGLDYSHVSRTVNQRGTNGAMATPMRLAGREINITMLATATTERGMRYGLDWLAGKLASIGGRCGDGRILMKLYCPEGVDGVFDQGNVELRQVTLLRGPEFTSNYLEGAGHMVREVMVTLLAGDPCFYTSNIQCLAPSNYTLPQVNLSALCGTKVVMPHGQSLAQMRASCDAMGGVDLTSPDGVTYTCEGIGAVPVADLLCGAIGPHALPFNPASPVCSVGQNGVLESLAATVQIHMLGGVSGPFMIESWMGDPSDNPSTVIGRGGSGIYLGRIGVNVMSGNQGVKIDAVSGIVERVDAWGEPWRPDDSLIMFNNVEVPFFPRMAGEYGLGLFVAVRPYYVCSGTGEFQVSIDITSVSGCLG